MRTLAHLLAGVLLLLPGAVAAGRDIYVSNLAGDDRFAGEESQVRSDEGGPVRTLAKALRLAHGGDRIVIEKTDRPYRESISLVGSRLSGSPERPLVIQGNGAILDGSAPVPPQAWQHDRDAIFRFRPPQMGYQQLFLGDRPAVRVPVGPLADRPPRLQPREWCFLLGSIYFGVEPTKLPQDYPLRYARLQTGITLYQVEHVAIADLTVQGFQIDGISAFNTARHVTLAGVTSRGNGRAGVTVGGASIVEFDACLLGNNGQAQLLTLPGSETHVRNSRLLSNMVSGWVDRGGRVFIDGKQVEGGRNEVQPEGQPPKEKKGDEKPPSPSGRGPG
jgi:hypothetical protein